MMLFIKYDITCPIEMISIGKTDLQSLVDEAVTKRLITREIRQVWPPGLFAME
jgi:hypothetical protein